YMRVRRPKDAIPLYEQAYAGRKKLHGPVHRDTLDCLSLLSKAYRAVGRHDDSLRLLQEALDELKAKLGPNHSYTLQMLRWQAVAYNEAGQWPRAEEIYRNLLNARGPRVRSSHPVVATAWNDLSSAFQKNGRLEELIDLARTRHAVIGERNGRDHPETL